MTTKRTLQPEGMISAGFCRGGAIVLAVMVGTGISTATEPQENLVVEISPDHAYQVAIGDVAKAADEDTFNRRVDRLIATGRHDLTTLTSQILYFSTRNQKDAGMKAIVGRVLKRLNAPKHAMVMALAPHLDNRDEAVRSMTRDLLSGYEDGSATRPPDFTVYRAIIEAALRVRKDPQQSLVRYMYESDPGSALLTMLRAFQLRDPEEIKPILWAEHVVAELFWKRRYGFMERTAVDPAVVLELDKLSRHGHWWVRLYAAEVVNQHPELGGEALVKRLAADANRLVRESIRGEGSRPASDLRKE